MAHYFKLTMTLIAKRGPAVNGLPSYFTAMVQMPNQIIHSYIFFAPIFPVYYLDFNFRGLLSATPTPRAKNLPINDE